MYNRKYGTRELTPDVVRKIAPSVFATRASETRSGLYNFIPTNKIIEMMVGAGYGVYGAMQSRTRIDLNEGFQKHMVILRHKDDVRAAATECPELLLMNSHNGGGAFRLMSGEIRFACENGLIIVDGKQDDVRISHRHNDAVAQVKLAMYDLRDKAIKHKQVTDAWKQVNLMRMRTEDVIEWRRQVFEVRWGMRPDLNTSDNRRRVFAARRAEDTHPDLYTQMNVAQENMLRGGFKLWDEEERKDTREVSEVNGLDARVQINRELWRITAEFAKECA